VHIRAFVHNLSEKTGNVECYKVPRQIVVWSKSSLTKDSTHQRKASHTEGPECYVLTREEETILVAATLLQAND